MKLSRVVKPGFFTTVQDLGRAGFLRFGVPVSGAMDDFSLQLANMLVGNSPSDACLEITVIGPELQALSDTQIALGGGDLSPLVNNEEVAMWQTINIKKGDVISFGKLRNGCRAYLSVRGGINVPLVLGSRSTYTRCQLGGVQGRQLKTGDVLEGFDSANLLNHRLALPSDLFPDFNSEVHVNVVLGPHLDKFTRKGVKTFLSHPYAITLEADRMGYRTEGSAIELKTRGDVISDAILPGAVQVPSDGKPIIMMKDAQTTGGYAKIAVVVTTDIHVLGQAKPNDKVRFHEISLAEARDGLREYKEKLRAIERKLISGTC
jgi:antagonist of KipI